MTNVYYYDAWSSTSANWNMSYNVTYGNSNYNEPVRAKKPPTDYSIWDD